MDVMLPKKYAETRWLSLGQSLQRILRIWPSLKQYTQIYIPKKEKEGFKKAEEI